MASIELQQVRKAFAAVEVIKGVELEIGRGEFMVFVGPSGCGKSTLLRLIAGLEDVTSGEIRFDGKMVNALPPSKRGIAMVFQSYALYPHMSVYQNMAFGLSLEKGKSRHEIRQRVEKTAKMLGISAYLERLPKHLSGGQRQRVAIGRAMTRNPGVFLFDEPLSNLDAELRVATRLEIARLHAEMNHATMVYVTHDQVEAMTLAERICVLRDGRVEQVGTPMELYERPANLFVAGFIGSPRMNFIGGDKASVHRAHTIGIRAEHICIVPDNGVWTGTVIHSENLGADAYVYVNIGTGDPVVVRSDGVNHSRAGDTVHISPMQDKIYRFNAAGTPIVGDVQC